MHHTPPLSTAAGWGIQGPGPRYIEAGGDRHLYTNPTVRYRVHNLIWMARLLATHPIPTNLRTLDVQERGVSR
jgi:hypothetical protein